MSTNILFNEYKYCKIIQTNLKLWVHMSTNNEKYLVLRGKNRDIYFIQKRLSKSQANALGKDFIKKSFSINFSHSFSSAFCRAGFEFFARMALHPLIRIADNLEMDESPIFP